MTLSFFGVCPTKFAGPRQTDLQFLKDTEDAMELLESYFCGVSWFYHGPIGFTLTRDAANTFQAETAKKTARIAELICSKSESQRNLDASTGMDFYIYIGYKICLYKVKNGHIIMRHPHCIH